MKYHINTTFSLQGFNDYGKKFLDTFPWDDERVQLSVVYDDTKLEPKLKNYPKLVVLKNIYCEQIEHFISTNKNKFSQDNFLYSPNRFIFKPSSLLTADKYLSINDSNYLIWIDGDSYFKKDNIADLIDFIKPHKNHIASVFDRFDYCNYLEAGFIIFNRCDSRYLDVIHRCLDIFLTNDIFNMMEWHDAFIFTQIMNEYPPNSFRHLCREFNIKGAHPIQKFKLSYSYIDHLKGSRKNAGSSSRLIFIPYLIFNYLKKKFEKYI